MAYWNNSEKIKELEFAGGKRGDKAVEP